MESVEASYERLSIRCNWKKISWNGKTKEEVSWLDLSTLCHQLGARDFSIETSREFSEAF